MLLVHGWRWVRYGFLAYLLVFSALLFHESIDRYYDGDWGRVWRALPLTRPLDGIATNHIDYLALPFPTVSSATRIDGILDIVSCEGSRIQLAGWAPLRDNSKHIKYQVYTKVSPESVAGRRDFRPDVAQIFNDRSYRKSGFKITLSFPDEVSATTAAGGLCITASAEESGEVFLLNSKNASCLQLLQGAEINR
jgi:hypothetical protein